MQQNQQQQANKPPRVNGAKHQQFPVGPHREYPPSESRAQIECRMGSQRQQPPPVIGNQQLAESSSTNVGQHYTQIHQEQNKTPRTRFQNEQGQTQIGEVVLKRRQSSLQQAEFQAQMHGGGQQPPSAGMGGFQQQLQPMEISGGGMREQQSIHDLMAQSAPRGYAGRGALGSGGVPSGQLPHHSSARVVKQTPNGANTAFPQMHPAPPPPQPPPAAANHPQRIIVHQQQTASVLIHEAANAPPPLSLPPPYVGSQRFAASLFSEGATQSFTASKERYRSLKKKFKFLVYENEYYQEELRNLQRKLLKLSRDKNFLLDRLGHYENLSESSDDSDASAKTVEDKMVTKQKRKQKQTPNRKRAAPGGAGQNNPGGGGPSKRSSAGNSKGRKKGVAVSKEELGPENPTAGESIISGQQKGGQSGPTAEESGGPTADEPMANVSASNTTEECHPEMKVKSEIASVSADTTEVEEPRPSQ